MALNIKIDVDNCYTTFQNTPESNFSFFTSELKNGTSIKLGIKISSEAHPFLQDVFNLAFGPVIGRNKIDDQALIEHQNYSKVFSTIVSACLNFLIVHEGKYLGIDGTNTARAYMYYRCIQNNFDYLNRYFLIYGVNYYTRLYRDDVDRNGSSGFLAIPQLIHSTDYVHPDDLYNYFIFKAR